MLIECPHNIYDIKVMIYLRGLMKLKPRNKYKFGCTAKLHFIYLCLLVQNNILNCEIITIWFEKEKKIVKEKYIFQN